MNTLCKTRHALLLSLLFAASSCHAEPQAGAGASPRPQPAAQEQAPPNTVRLFAEDFSRARLGTGRGNWYVYEYDANADVERPGVTRIPVGEGQWLKMPRKGFVFPNDFARLPEHFTLEFDMYADPQRMSEHEGGLKTVFIARNDRHEHSIYWDTHPAIELDVHPHGGNSGTVNIEANREYGSAPSGTKQPLFSNTFSRGWNPGQVNRISIVRNGAQVLLHLNGMLMYSQVDALTHKGPYNLMFSSNLNGDGVYVSNVRIDRGNTLDATANNVPHSQPASGGSSQSQANHHPARAAGDSHGRNTAEEKLQRQVRRQQQRTESEVDHATDRAVDKVTDKVLNSLFGGG